MSKAKPSGQSRLIRVHDKAQRLTRGRAVPERPAVPMRTPDLSDPDAALGLAAEPIVVVTRQEIYADLDALRIKTLPASPDLAAMLGWLMRALGDPDRTTIDRLRRQIEPWLPKHWR